MNVLFHLLFCLDYCLCQTLFSLECLSFTLHIIFPLVPIQKSRGLCDNCLVYITSLVSNNYLGSNKCSVDNHFHFSSECFVSSSLLFDYCLCHLLFCLDYCLCQTLFSLECLSFTLHIIFPLVPIQKSRGLCDNCLVYITSLVSNNYLGSNKCSVDNHFHFSSECLVSYCSSV